jgi:uncharacterized iron-regulated membrane protein
VTAAPQRAIIRALLRNRAIADLAMLHRLLHAPQHLWVRRALFQIHLWAGIGVGLYVFVIGVSGSVLMFRAELAGPDPAILANAEPDAPAIGIPAVVATARAARPNGELLGVYAPAAPRDPFIAWVEENEVIDPVVVHPTTGAILGVRRQQAWLDWLQDLHFYLLGGDTGLVVNGIGGLLLLAMGLTGLVVWWPGVGSWRRSLTIDFSRHWRRINWDLHSAVGFWTSLMLVMWAATGVYFAFPAQFRAAVNAVSALSPAEPVVASAGTAGAGGRSAQLAAALAAAHEAVPGATVARISFPRTGASALEVVMAPHGIRRSNEIGYVSLYFDRNSGALLERRKHDVASAGDFVMVWVGAAPTGNFGGWPLKILWALLGLAPPLLFVTGVLMWWIRVVRRKLGRAAP